MEEIKNKLNQLEKLKEEEAELTKKLKQQQNSIKLNLIFSNKKRNLQDFADFVIQNELSREDHEKVKSHFIGFLRENLRTRNTEGARTMLNNLIKMNVNNQDLKTVFNETLDEILDSTSKLRAPVRISILETIRKIDEEDILCLSLHIKDLELDLIKELIQHVDVNPKALDKFLGEITEIGVTINHLKEHLRDVYCKYEKMYFEKALRIIQKGDPNTVLEDVVCVIHKIKRRNNLMGQDQFDYIKTTVYDKKILKTEEEYLFFEKMFY
ncbi:hypothetical protein NBO_456g0004 [Nosema bombycis CQ1]|uniref:Uncharacterized protein n=1 Tax=Nosema bombycis (strain CQ1 / CVCC 102059) TaxID=578461 RepID=R0ME77_NOSB1|nr:hypothetical protein NBO_456g0004 [Nosema bombycis CQ1]|eukprot:EOB12370.1 hypothetical protein NBO_456g0004 [Nosema bombycis CQ1]